MRCYILSLDPGGSSGVALGYIDDDTPYTLVKAWQFGGGTTGMIEWIRDRFESHRQDAPGLWWFDPDPYDEYDEVYDAFGSFGNHIICEKFKPINHGNYALTTASVESLRVEGALIALGVMPDYPHKTWVEPKQQYLYGGSDLAEKKKRARLYLKSRGMHLTGKTVGQADADDARSATWHGISYAVKVLHHRPTSASITEWSESHGLD